MLLSVGSFMDGVLFVSAVGRGPRWLGEERRRRGKVSSKVSCDI